MQVLLPGETAKPNTASGKEGTPTQNRAGVPFIITVNVTDVLWNIVGDISPNVRVESTDQYGTVIDPLNVPDGTVTQQMTLYNAEMAGFLGKATHYINVYHLGPTIYNGQPVWLSTGTSSSFDVIPDTVNYSLQYHIIVPNQVPDPGNISNEGKKYEVSVQTAGVKFPVTVRVTDNYYNLWPYASVGLVTLRVTDPNNSGYSVTSGLTQGQKVWSGAEAPFLVSVSTWQNWKVYATGLLATKYSNEIPLVPNIPKQLQVLAPGEVTNPGNKTNRGRDITKKPANQVAGVGFTVTVNACDEYYNVTSATPIVKIVTDDLYDIEPSTKALLNGTTTFTVQLVTRSTSSIVRATTDYAPGWLQDWTQGIFVSTNTPYRIQVLVPGEIPVEGKWENAPGPNTQPGKTENSSPITQTAGVGVEITIRCVDRYYNLVPENPVVKLISDGAEGDPYDVPPAGIDTIGKQLVNGQYILTGSEKWVFVTRNRATDTLINETYPGGGWRIRVLETAWTESEPYGNLVPNSAPTAKIPIEPGVSYRPQILVPDERPVWGSISNSGKTGSVLEQTAGVPFEVSVYPVDYYFNRAIKKSARM